MATYFKKRLPAIALATILWGILAFTRKAYLLKTGDLSLFLFDWTFLKESFMIPGGFLGWAGSFFAQFLVIPWLGALLWVILLYAACLITSKTFGLTSKLATISLIPVAFLVIANMSLGYGIFIMRTQEYFFAPTLGYLLILAITYAVWKADRTWLRITILTASALIGYVLAGVFALAGVAAAGLGLIGRLKDWRRLAEPAISIILCLVAPLLLYGLFTRYRLVDSWQMGLPSISDDTWTTAIRLPYWLLIGFPIVLALFRNLFDKIENNSKKYATAHICIAAIAISAVIVFWFRDENFNTELTMSAAIDRYDWKEVTDIYQKASMRHIKQEQKTLEKRKEALTGVQDEDTYYQILDKFESRFFQPTRLMVLYRDLALLKQGKALDMAFSMRDGGREQKSRTQIPMVWQAGRQLYLNYGLINQEYRWCLEDQVEHGWCFGTLKYMAMHAILMNETEFAAKYLDKLDKTLFFRNWSKSQRPLSRDYQAMSKMTPYKEAIPLMSFDDRMSNDRIRLENYLLSHFAQDRDSQATPQFDTAALLWAMRSQDIPLFWKALSQYMETAQEPKLPKCVQEAIVLFSSLRKENMGIPVDKAVSDSYSAFMKTVQQSHYRSEKEASFPIWLKFGNTYYYYYYFIRNLQSI